MADTQIANLKVGAGLSDYTLPEQAELVLKAVNADFVDNGAAGDWLPAVIIFSDSAHVIARAADQAVLVTGGDDAEVSWFPGVKNPGAGFAGLPFAFAHQPTPAGSYPSGAVITPAWGATGLSGPSTTLNSGFHLTPNGAEQDLNVSAFGLYFYTVVVTWDASFAGNRYVEVSVPVSAPMPQRFEQSGTPEGDVLVLSGAFIHSRAADDLVSVNLMQASGADRGVTEVYLFMVEAPFGP